LHCDGHARRQRPSRHTPFRDRGPQPASVGMMGATVSFSRIAVVGAGGYTGEQLVSILLRHPAARIVGLFGSGRDGAAKRLEQVAPRLAGSGLPAIEHASPDAIAAVRPDAVFLCTPHEASAHLAPELVSRDIITLD